MLGSGLPEYEDLRRGASPRSLCCRTRSSPDKTLVLDLDETLVFASLDIGSGSDYAFSFKSGEQKCSVSVGLTQVFVSLRPRVKEFLECVAAHFEVVVFTASVVAGSL